MHSLRYWWLVATSSAGLVAVAACSGVSNLAPSTPAAAVAAPPRASATLDARHEKRGTAQIVIRIPRKKKPGRRMHPEYISPSTQSMSVEASGQSAQIFNLTPASTACSTSAATGYLTCTETAFFPSGQRTISIYLYDQPNAKGNQLSSATTSITIAQGGTTTIPITLDGIAVTAKVLINGSATASVPIGTATSVPVSVDAYDADDNLIMLPGNYSSAVTLTDSDSSGATSLSESSATSPGESLTLSYNGATLSSLTVTATVSGNPQPNGSAFLDFTAPGPTITEYSSPSWTLGNPSNPFDIIKGPDGNMWFTEYITGQIGSITPSGSITQYGGLTGSQPEGITVGPDGALWFAENCANFPDSYIGRMTTTGGLTEYETPTLASTPVGIAAGPDGNLWFTEQTKHQIGQMTTAGAVMEFPIPSRGEPYSITKGPDGALWFTESGSDQIGRITTSGAVTEYTSSNAPTTGISDGIVTGPDGTLWFTGANGNTPEISNITTSGAVAGTYTLPVPNGTYPQAFGIAVGPDNALWFSYYANQSMMESNIGRITTTGAVTLNAIPATGSKPFGIAPGPGGLWFTDLGTQSAIGVVSVAGSAARRRHAPLKTLTQKGTSNEYH